MYIISHMHNLWFPTYKYQIRRKWGARASRGLENWGEWQKLTTGMKSDLTESWRYLEEKSCFCIFHAWTTAISGGCPPPLWLRFFTCKFTQYHMPSVKRQINGFSSLSSSYIVRFQCQEEIEYLNQVSWIRVINSIIIDTGLHLPYVVTSTYQTTSTMNKVCRHPHIKQKKQQQKCWKKYRPIFTPF